MNDMKAVWTWYEEACHFGFIDADERTYSQHRQWFRRVLENDDQILLIATIANLRVGATLFRQISKDNWAAAIMFKAFYMHKPIGVPIWEAALTEFHRDARRVGANVRVDPALQNLLENPWL